MNYEQDGTNGDVSWMMNTADGTAGDQSFPADGYVEGESFNPETLQTGEEQAMKTDEETKKTAAEISIERENQNAFVKGLTFVLSPFKSMEEVSELLKHPSELQGIMKQSERYSVEFSGEDKKNGCISFTFPEPRFANNSLCQILSRRERLKYGVKVHYPGETENLLDTLKAYQDEKKKAREERFEELKKMSVFLSNVPLTATKENLQSLFPACPHIVITNDRGKPCGRATLRFESPEAAKQCMSDHTVAVIQGLKLVLSRQPHVDKKRKTSAPKSSVPPKTARMDRGGSGRGRGRGGAPRPSPSSSFGRGSSRGARPTGSAMGGFKNTMSRPGQGYGRGETGRGRSPRITYSASSRGRDWDRSEYSTGGMNRSGFSGGPSSGGFSGGPSSGGFSGGPSSGGYQAAGGMSRGGFSGGGMGRGGYNAAADNWSEGQNYEGYGGGYAGMGEDYSGSQWKEPEPVMPASKIDPQKMVEVFETAIHTIKGQIGSTGPSALPRDDPYSSGAATRYGDQMGSRFGGQSAGSYGGQSAGSYGRQSAGSYGVQSAGSYGDQSAGSYGDQSAGSRGGAWGVGRDGGRPGGGYY